MPETLEREYAKLQIREVNAALSSGMFVHVRGMLQDMEPCDIALLLESSPPKGRTILWQLVEADLHGEVLEELAEDVRNGIIHQMTPERVVAATEGMDDDDLAEVLRGLPDALYRNVINAMDSQDRLRAEKVMSYDEDTAGAIMNTDTITLRPDVSIDVILRYLRLKGELPEATDYLYVVDDNDTFVGAISLSTLLTCNPDLNVKRVLEDDIEVIPVDMEERDVAQLFERHNWVSAPVVDEEGRLLGRITIDDVVDVIREEAEHSMMSMAGLDDEEDTFAPVIKSTQRRSLWLGINLFTALLAAFVSDLFESTLDQLAVLAVLNTIVPSMGGVAGSQTLTLVIRGMALGHISKANSRWLMGKELAIGLLNGAMWAILIASVVAIWKQSFMLGVVIAFAMLMNMIAAGVSGVFIPLMLKRFNIDPALAGGVILTTVTDIIGIFTFLGTATWLLL
ncbi:magnesium transporter [Flocculibacter collagenilyticus]|uniref:magnesium transporter n=1 Tax=Flocculibacter collagenilyticus TaxID=2744479 RepID=UPI0018F5B24F|nr:magnesium transporter [Flocculibacter collagenilyticus]